MTNLVHMLRHMCDLFLKGMSVWHHIPNNSQHIWWNIPKHTRPHYMIYAAASTGWSLNCVGVIVDFLIYCFRLAYNWELLPHAYTIVSLWANAVGVAKHITVWTVMNGFPPLVVSFNISMETPQRTTHKPEAHDAHMFCLPFESGAPTQT